MPRAIDFTCDVDEGGPSPPPVAASSRTSSRCTPAGRSASGSRSRSGRTQGQPFLLGGGDRPDQATPMNEAGAMVHTSETGAYSPRHVEDGPRHDEEAAPRLRVRGGVPPDDGGGDLRGDGVALVGRARQHRFQRLHRKYPAGRVGPRARRVDRGARRDHGPRLPSPLDALPPYTGGGGHETRL